VVLVLFFMSGYASTIQVRHDHDPSGSCKGELSITAEGIQYETEKEKHRRVWKWTDIQTVDRKSTMEFTVLTYADQKLLLGRDQPYDFTVVEGEGLTESAFELIEQSLPRPVVDRIPGKPTAVEYEVPVKHLHTFGGCEGVLRFGSELVVYETDHAKDSRTWRRNREVAGIWSTGPYDLELEVYEREGGDLLRTRRFRFQLKEPLNSDFYYSLRRQLVAVR
jgi:hypothetical protein